MLMANEKKKQPVISMTKAVELLDMRMFGPGTARVPTDVSDVYILCPNCCNNHNSNRLTLNINFEDNVFGCPRCGFNGGVYRLVSHFTGWNLRETEKNIKAGKLASYVPSDYTEGEDESLSVVEAGRDMAPLKQRHEVYTFMLEHLHLSSDHRADLLKRGLNNETIEKIGFKSLPKYMDLTSMPKKLITSGLDLRGVPGFGINDAGDWALARMPDGGYLIPNRNGQGLIQGFQIRFDHPTDTIPKYGYLTSKGMAGGTRCNPWCCWAGENLLARKNDRSKPFDVVLIEGPLKAYIVNHITGANIISVPGVNALKKVPSALQSLDNLGLRRVYIAYDMDFETNDDVKNQLERLKAILADLNIKTMTLFWDPTYKGLDDYVTGSPEFKELLLMWSK